MSLYDEIIAIYPELQASDFDKPNEKIKLQNDSDGFGDFIVEWNYEKPLPKGFKVGK